MYVMLGAVNLYRYFTLILGLYLVYIALNKDSKIFSLGLGIVAIILFFKDIYI